MNKEFPEGTTLNEALDFLRRAGATEFTRIYDKEGIFYFNSE